MSGDRSLVIPQPRKAWQAALARGFCCSILGNSVGSPMSGQKTASYSASYCAKKLGLYLELRRSRIIEIFKQN